MPDFHTKFMSNTQAPGGSTGGGSLGTPSLGVSVPSLGATKSSDFKVPNQMSGNGKDPGWVTRNAPEATQDIGWLGAAEGAEAIGDAIPGPDVVTGPLTIATIALSGGLSRDVGQLFQNIMEKKPATKDLGKSTVTGTEQTGLGELGGRYLVQPVIRPIGNALSKALGKTSDDVIQKFISATTKEIEKDKTGEEVGKWAADSDGEKALSKATSTPAVIGKQTQHQSLLDSISGLDEKGNKVNDSLWGNAKDMSTKGHTVTKYYKNGIKKVLSGLDAGVLDKDTVDKLVDKAKDEAGTGADNKTFKKAVAEVAKVAGSGSSEIPPGYTAEDFKLVQRFSEKQGVGEALATEGNKGNDIYTLTKNLDQHAEDIFSDPKSIQSDKTAAVALRSLRKSLLNSLDETPGVAEKIQEVFGKGSPEIDSKTNSEFMNSKTISELDQKGQRYVQSYKVADKYMEDMKNQLADTKKGGTLEKTGGSYVMRRSLWGLMSAAAGTGTGIALGPYAGLLVLGALMTKGVGSSGASLSDLLTQGLEMKGVTGTISRVIADSGMVAVQAMGGAFSLNPPKADSNGNLTPSSSTVIAPSPLPLDLGNQEKVMQAKAAAGRIIAQYGGNSKVNSAMDSLVKSVQDQNPELTTTQRNAIQSYNNAVKLTDQIYSQAMGISQGVVGGNLEKLSSDVRGALGGTTKLTAYNQNIRDKLSGYLKAIGASTGSSSTAASMTAKINTYLPTATDSREQAYEKIQGLVSDLEQIREDILNTDSTEELLNQ